ncbi:MAG: hypothetical protein IK058_03955 [Bacteroidales bacterium]|nr:hypothetical protein [Bacteroidales bacterium]
MKRLGLLLVCVAALAMTSCSSLQSASASNPVAYASGQACGTAVQGLYGSYRNTGKLDLTAGNNLTNALAVATAYSQMQQNKNSQSYRRAFTNGLIASSSGLITTANATSFVDKLLGTTALANVNANSVSQTATTAMAIITLLNTLKQ